MSFSWHDAITHCRLCWLWGNLLYIELVHIFLHISNGVLNLLGIRLFTSHCSTAIKKISCHKVRMWLLHHISNWRLLLTLSFFWILLNIIFKEYSSVDQQSSSWAVACLRSFLYSGILYSSTTWLFSQAICSSGNMGHSLGYKTSVFLSADAGLSWHQVS